MENQSSHDKTILLRSFLYVLSLYDTLWRQSRKGLLPNVLPVILYNGQADWRLPGNLRGLIEKRLPEPWIPSFECFVIVEKDIPEETLNRLHNLVAAVMLLERQQDEEGLAEAILQVIDFIKGENMTAIRDIRQVDASPKGGAYIQHLARCNPAELKANEQQETHIRSVVG